MARKDWRLIRNDSKAKVWRKGNTNVGIGKPQSARGLTSGMNWEVFVDKGRERILKRTKKKSQALKKARAYMRRH